MKSVKLVLLLLFLMDAIYSQNIEELVIAKRVNINSKILGEDRSILISVPNNYSESNKSYPVFYILDGWSGAISITNELSGSGLCPEMIVVVIEQIKPCKDMFPSMPRYARGSKPGAPWYNKNENNELNEIQKGEKCGEADEFLSFVENELFPFIEKNYRTVPYRICTGHSRGGLCVTHAFLSHTHMFNAYIALNASLYWDDGLILRTAEEKLYGKDLKYKQFYFNIGGKEVPSTIGDAHTFAEILNTKSSDNLRWKFDYQENESHAAGAMSGLISGLSFIYEGWEYDMNKMKAGGINAIDSFNKKLSERYGYEISADISTLNSIGWEILKDGKYNEAIKIFEENTRRNPQSADAYNYLAEGHLKAGNIEMAIKTYEKAIETASTFKSGNVEFLKQRLESIKTGNKK